MLKAIGVILRSAAVVGCSSTSPSPVGPWTVTSVSPVRGSTAGGTLLTIVGSGFQSGTTVTIGGVKQVLSSFGGSTVLYLTTTAQEAGIAEMVITAGTVAGVVKVSTAPKVMPDGFDEMAQYQYWVPGSRPVVLTE